MGEFAKPLLIGSEHFEGLGAGPDPADHAAAGHRVAHLLVRGAHDPEDAALVDRVLHLADAEGLGTIAALWSASAFDTIAGSLWRLYLLSAWVHRQPDRAAREFEAGRAWAPVDEALAGVEQPPGPREVVELVDAVIRGILQPDFDVALDRAAAFAQVTAAGRAHLDPLESPSAAKLMDMARQLRHAARLERASTLP